MKESYIKNLHVKDVGLFEELDIKFNKRFNFIIGPNASGKTSILKCMALTMDPENAKFSRYGENSELWIDFIHDEKNFRMGLGKGWVINPEEYRGARMRQPKEPPPGENMISLAFYDLSLSKKEIDFCPLFIGAYRRIDYREIEGIQREKSPSKQRENYRQSSIRNLEGIFLPNVKRWIINRYFSFDKKWSEVERKNWEWLIENMMNIPPKDTDFRFIEIKKDLEPVFSLNGIQCYLEELSAGYQAILSLIFCIFDWIEGIYKNDEDRFAKNARGSVIIDELDIHMHPEWQFKIRDTLERIFPNLQFITTTHSPHLIASAKSNEIIILPQFSRTVDVKPTSKTYSGWTTDQILEDIMGVKSLENKLYNRLLKEALDCVNKNDIKN